jgi:hypothetical protein
MPCAPKVAREVEPRPSCGHAKREMASVAMTSWKANVFGYLGFRALLDEFVAEISAYNFDTHSSNWMAVLSVDVDERVSLEPADTRSRSSTSVFIMTGLDGTEHADG